MKRTKAFFLTALLIFTAGAVFGQNGTWTQYLASNFGLSGLTAPQDTEPGFETGDPCRVWFRSDDGTITEAVFIAFAQQIWNQSGRAPNDGNYEMTVDMRTYQVVKGKRLTQLNEARTEDDEYMWCYTYRGQTWSVQIQHGSRRELRLNIERL